MGIREERSRGRTRLAFLTSGERDAAPPDTPSEPEWLAEPVGTVLDGDTTWSAERRRGGFSLPDRWRDARFDPGRSGALVLIVVGIVVATATVLGVRSDRPETQAVPSLPAAGVHSLTPAPVTTAPAAAASAPAPAEEIVVSVVGLVASAGLVRLPPGSRVADALAAAGGVRDGGDTLGLNLAQRLSDGDQVLVGAATTQAPPSAVGGASAASPGTAGAAAVTGGGLVNLNTATETELDALPGVGPVTAAAIVAWRTTNGTFTDISQLREVDGIGPVRLEKLRGQVTL
ncbi:ComEA family DNA-binding protein [Rhodococcus sp. JVH1]|uniref:ComEA family DNA-binding protein n=1 Tax=Rhodococcus sp. JVH1 TaxID=745408 RepID=UPI0002721C3A|nr:ComEA family DNA-binding protein [Rhodococcus sp. JVH1]EJJ00690.1 competence protein ComEA helix-hairpin-helix repeat region domain protein [Rhodococcus sp. JVH1]